MNPLHVNAAMMHVRIVKNGQSNHRLSDGIRAIIQAMPAKSTVKRPPTTQERAANLSIRLLRNENAVIPQYQRPRKCVGVGIETHQLHTPVVAKQFGQVQQEPARNISVPHWQTGA